MSDRQELSGIVVDAAYQMHRDLGPGLLESDYEIVLAAELERRGLKAVRQVPVTIRYRGMAFEGAFRADLLVENELLIELKSVEKLQSVHAKQLLSYLRLMDLRVGLLINFGEETLKQGLKRVVNNYER